jgi:hypothetical protein
VRLAILDERQDRGRQPEESDTEESTSRAVFHLSNDRHGRRALERLIVREAIDCVIVATADPSRVTWPNMPPSVARCVWPTGTGARSRRAFGRSTTPHLELPGEDAWVALATADRPPARSTLSLWDGDYVLVPIAPVERVGAEIVSAFARLADDWSSHDLVILGDFDPALERLARELGVVMRVHFVGAAERQAEWAWWTHAAAGVIAASDTISGGLLLRALSAGCPLHVVSGTRGSEAARVWLARHGCVPLRSGSVDLGDEIARLLEHGPEVDESIEHGRALAAQYDFRALVTRLQTALPRLGDRSAGRSAA